MIAFFTFNFRVSISIHNSIALSLLASRSFSIFFLCKNEKKKTEKVINAVTNNVSTHARQKTQSKRGH